VLEVFSLLIPEKRKVSPNFAGINPVTLYVSNDTSAPLEFKRQPDFIPVPPLYFVPSTSIEIGI
jgi:hypothetical protein